MRLPTQQAVTGPLGRKVLCPRCGCETYEGLPSYPRCPRCHEYLRKCRYCHHFDFRVYHCSVLELLQDIERQPDLDEANQCRLYDTTLAPEYPGRREWRAAALRIGLAVLPALALIIAMIAFLPHGPPAGSPTLLLTAAIPEDVSMDDVAQFDLIINNTEEASVATIQLWLSNDLLRGFEGISAEPPPRAVVHGRKGITYNFGGLEGYGHLTITFTARPRKPGIFRLRAVLLGGRAGKGSTLNTAIEVLP